MADGEYRYILNYQDHGMKDVYPVALKTGMRGGGLNDE
eukprot:COSAG02_NODE_44194_length_368_cov_0.795539_1_plen_37_part_01